jgi:hypothetical protein
MLIATVAVDASQPSALVNELEERVRRSEPLRKHGFQQQIVVGVLTFCLIAIDSACYSRYIG